MGSVALHLYTPFYLIAIGSTPSQLAPKCCKDRMVFILLSSFMLMLSHRSEEEEEEKPPPLHRHKHHPVLVPKDFTVEQEDWLRIRYQEISGKFRARRALDEV